MSSVFNVMQVASEQLCREAEAQRRESPTITGFPLPNGAEVPDYGQSGQVMEIAMAHLRESVPNGQKQRTEKAFLALKLAVMNHERWLRVKGYDV